MDITPSEEHILLAESASKFLATSYSYAERRRIEASGTGYDADIWKQFAELGWLSLPLPEAHGGIGCGAVEVGVLMKAFGHSLVVEPYIPTVVLGAGLIAGAGSEEQKATMLPMVADGRLLLAFAHVEREAGFSLSHVATKARRDGGGWILNGSKTLVLGGPHAERYIVSARLSGETSGVRGIGLFMVDRDTAGLSVRNYALLDGSRAADLRLDEVRLDSCALLGDSEDAFPVIEKVVDLAIVALCSEALGAMERLLDATVAYTKARFQFGRPLSDNQVLKHRMVEMAVRCEEARSIVLYASLNASGEAAQRSRAASAAKAKIGVMARYVAEQAVQLHGAMGVTDELDIGTYFKRLMVVDTCFGPPAFHFRRFAALSPYGAGIEGI